MLRIPFVALALFALLAACSNRPGRDPRPLAPPERPPAPWVEEAPPTLRNALAGKTQSPIRVRATRTYLGFGYAWMQVRDDDAAEAWVAVPALSATPTDAFSIAEYVVTDGRGSPIQDVRIDKLLLASDVYGPDIALRTNGEDAVLDPLLPPIEVTGAAAVEPAKVTPLGPTIAEMRRRREELVGRTVKLRAQAWRVIPRVAGLNWIWARDGSAEGPEGELLIGLRAGIEPGGVFEFEGVLTIDRQIAGRSLDVVLEPARLAGQAPPKAAPAPAAQPRGVVR
ncbi:MAG: hypothetical protein RIT45_2763 [Pseudomonadota bacterium]|jgi:hypothetical protein